MFKVVTENSKNDVWATGFYSKDKAQKRIDSGYYHKNMFECDKHKKLVVMEY